MEPCSKDPTLLWLAVLHTPFHHPPTKKHPLPASIPPTAPPLPCASFNLAGSSSSGYSISRWCRPLPVGYLLSRCCKSALCHICNILSQSRDHCTGRTHQQDCTASIFNNDAQLLSISMSELCHAWTPLKIFKILTSHLDFQNVFNWIAFITIYILCIQLIIKTRCDFVFYNSLH